MEEEFDDTLDEICSQVPLFPCNQISLPKKENVFKVPEQPKYTAPKYAFNRVQTKLGSSFLASQQSNVFIQQKNLLPQNRNQNKVNPLQNGLKNQTNQFNNNQNKLHNQQSKPFTGNKISNLSKSIAAQNKNCKYSANKQIFPQGDIASSSKLNPSSNKNNERNQIILQQTKSNFSDLSSQVTVPSTSSSSSFDQQVNRSSFNISNNVSAEVSLNSTFKNLSNFAVDPADKFLGKIKILESDNKKKESEIQKLKEENEELRKIKMKEKEYYEKEIEAIKTYQYFDESARASKEIQETVLNSQFDKTLSNLNGTISSTTYQLKKQSPKINQRQTQSISQFPKFKNEDTSIFNMETDDENDFVIPDTQIIPDTQNVKPSIINNNNQTELELTVNDYEESIHTVEEGVKSPPDFQEDEDEVPATQIIPSQSIKIDSKNDGSQRTKIKRIKTEQPEVFQDDAIFHQARFKFIDFQIYDNLHEENRLNYYRENVNPIFDQIIGEIINSNMHSELSKFELKFSKLNEQLVLFLIYEDYRFNKLSELTFNLLANLNRYTNKLVNKELLPKMTSECFIIDNRDITSSESYKNYKRGQTLFNRMLEIFSSCRTISEECIQSYLRLCYSIILFLLENTVEDNQIAEFHSFVCESKCWLELFDTIGQFALFINEIFDKNNKLHYLVVRELIKFILVFYRTKSKSIKGLSNFAKFPHFAQKMATKIKLDQLDYLIILS